MPEDSVDPVSLITYSCAMPLPNLKHSCSKTGISTDTKAHTTLKSLLITLNRSLFDIFLHLERFCLKRLDKPIRSSLKILRVKEQYEDCPSVMWLEIVLDGLKFCYLTITEASMA